MKAIEAKQQRHELPAAERIEDQRGQRQPDHRGQMAAAAEREIAEQDDRQEQEDEGVGIEEHQAFPGGAEKPNHTTRRPTSMWVQPSDLAIRVFEPI